MESLEVLLIYYQQADFYLNVTFLFYDKVLIYVSSSYIIVLFKYGN